MSPNRIYPFYFVYKALHHGRFLCQNWIRKNLICPFVKKTLRILKNMPVQVINQRPSVISESLDESGEKLSAAKIMEYRESVTDPISSSYVSHSTKKVI